MVGCEVTDVSGRALLTGLNAQGLRMLCIEENQFSASMVARFRKLADQARPFVVHLAGL